MKSRRKNPKYVPKRPRDIIALTRILLRVVGSVSNILVTFDKLKKLFPKLRFKVVPDSQMPHVEARAYPKQWLIKIREGMHEGLRRGDPRARWTLAHELGHILLQHPKRLPRQRLAESVRSSNQLYEKEANLFACGVLAPYDQANKCQTPAEIASTFQISFEAALIRWKELRQEELRKRAALRFGQAPDTIAVETGHWSNQEEQAANVCAAISVTLGEASAPLRNSVDVLKNNKLGTATLSQPHQACCSTRMRA
jgi:Zn-dependent peptidase ImmA (M78 family)